MRFPVPFVSITAALMFAACVTPQQRIQQMQDAGDVQLQRRLTEARDTAETRPKNARVAMDYADIVIEAVEAGYYERRPGEVPPIQHVVGVLDTAAHSQPGDAAKLLTKKAEVYFQQGEVKPARETLYSVLESWVYVPAGILLVSSLGGTGDVEEVVRVCKAYNPLIDYGRAKLDFMTKCVVASGATSSETGLWWATDDDRAYYAASKQQHIEEQKRLEEERREREFERQQQEAEAEMYRREQLARREGCYDTCEEDNGYCRSGCGYVDRCYGECNRARDACLRKCDRTVEVPLSPQQREFREQMGW